MKAFIALIVFGVTLIVGTLTDDNNSYTDIQEEKILVTFDGYEGGFYFFSDKNSKAISLTDDDILPTDKNILQEGNIIGEKFKINLPKNKYNKTRSTTSNEPTSEPTSGVALN
jgi:hypothetical protein